MDARPYPSGTMGADKCRGLVRVDGVRDLGWNRNHTSGEDAADRPAGDILQNAVADSRSVSTLVNGYVGGIARGRDHVTVLVGAVAHRRRAVGVRVGELFLLAQESSTCSFVARSGLVRFGKYHGQ